MKKIVPKLLDNQEKAVFSVIAGIFLQGGKLSFRNRYDFVLSQMDPDIRTIINLTENDFIKIKDIRDAVAHGDAPDLIEADYGRVGIIVTKIALMLTYWAFMDFGLSKEVFLGCFQNQSQLHSRADIDHVHLERVTESAGFFQVSPEQFAELSQIKRIAVNACFRQYSDGRIEYDEHHVAAYQAWMRERESGEIPVARIFGQSKDTIRCWGHAYIESGAQRLELAQAWFIASI